jgi:hypothetical protein
VPVLPVFHFRPPARLCWPWFRHATVNDIRIKPPDPVDPAAVVEGIRSLGARIVAALIGNDAAELLRADPDRTSARP